MKVFFKRRSQNIVTTLPVEDKVEFLMPYYLVLLMAVLKQCNSNFKRIWMIP